VLHSQDDGNSCGTPADEYQKLGRLLALGAFLRRLLFVVWVGEKANAELNMLRVSPQSYCFVCRCGGKKCECAHSLCIRSLLLKGNCVTWKLDLQPLCKVSK